MIQPSEILEFCDLQVCEELSCEVRSRIVRLSPYSTSDYPHGKDWPNLHTANHNIFRLDADNQVVWQIQRVEEDFVNWAARHQHAKEADPTCEGYFDPFNHMSLQFFERHSLPYKGPFHPTQETIWFDDYAPGRLLSLSTHWWAYDLDPITGIATCTGEQVK